MSEDVAGGNLFELKSQLPRDFSQHCKRLLKVCGRNRIIRQRLRLEEERLSVQPGSFDQLVKQQVEKEKRKRSIRPGPSLLLTMVKGIKLGQNSCFMWYILLGKGNRSVIPDYEMSYCREVFKKMLKDTPNGEAHFGLGKLNFHDGNYQEAYYHLGESLKYSNDMVFSQWHSYLTLLFYCNNKEEAAIVLARLENYSRVEPSLENYWGLFELSLKGLLTVRQEIEMPHFYATKIKNLDTYYGYLAYSRIFIKEGFRDKAVSVLRELISHNPARPEAYIVLFSLYYPLKDFDASEDLMTQAFLRVNDAEYDAYIIIFSLYLAKIYSKQRKYTYAFEILQEKFVEHPEFSIFLYQYGRMCTKAEDLNYLSSAIGALQECLRLCDAKKHGKVYYWLTKAYYKKNRLFEAYLSSTFALERLKSSKKQADLRELLKRIKPLVAKAEAMYTLYHKTEYKSCIEKVSDAEELEIIKFLRAEALWKLNMKDSAIKYLLLCIDNKEDKLPLYFLLAKYLKKQKDYAMLNKVCKKMIHIAKNTQAVTGEWVNSNIWYARAKSCLGRPEKSVALLQCLAKVFPPLQQVDVPYTKYLIKAKTAADFMQASQKSLKNRIYDFSPIVCSVMATENTLNSLEYNEPLHTDKRREFAVNLLEDSLDEGSFEISVLPNELERPHHMSNKSFDVSIVRLNDRGLMTLNAGNAPTGNAFVGFSVCSEIRFLYYIAKICLSHEWNFDDGLCAIQDFLSLVRLEKDESARQCMNARGLFVKSFLLIRSGRFAEGHEMFKELKPELERLGMTHKLEEARKYLRFN